MTCREDGPAQAAVAVALNNQAKFIVQMAMGNDDYRDSAWIEIRDAAGKLLERCLHNDGTDIQESVLGLSTIILSEKRRVQALRKAKGKPIDIPIAGKIASLHRVGTRKDLWTALYGSLTRPNTSAFNSTGMTILLKVIADFAHIEKLNRYDTWSYERVGLTDVLSEEVYGSSQRAINRAIKNCTEAFGPCMETVMMQSDSRELKVLWNKGEPTQAAIMLLLCPVESIHDSMISLVQQSFDDVDDRGDCFRALLKHNAVAAMDGLIRFLDKFLQTATLTPESCSLSKWLVRCFTDILDVLCGQSSDEEPLLQSAAFLQAQGGGKSMRSRIEALWGRMALALSTIFKRTPDWAQLYDNATMVDWMRDALIFGRQIADNFRSFEAALSGSADASSPSIDFDSRTPARATRTGKKLLHKLEPVLKDLTSWLRLTE